MMSRHTNTTLAHSLPPRRLSITTTDAVYAIICRLMTLPTPFTIRLSSFHYHYATPLFARLLFDCLPPFAASHTQAMFSCSHALFIDAAHFDSFMPCRFSRLTPPLRAREFAARALLTAHAMRVTRVYAKN